MRILKFRNSRGLEISGSIHRESPFRLAGPDCRGSTAPDALPELAALKADITETERRMDRRRAKYTAALLKGGTTRSQTTTFNAEMGNLAERRDRLRKMLSDFLKDERGSVAIFPGLPNLRAGWPAVTQRLKALWAWLWSEQQTTLTLASTSQALKTSLI